VDATTLYLEPFGGMAGDMFLAALLDLGDERFGPQDLVQLAAALVPGECEVRVEPARRGSLAATLVSVRTRESEHPPHRHLAECAALIEGSPLSPAARARATAMFRRIAEAEARVHGISVDEVHFHEVGAVDALIDICGAALALERLGVERVLATPPRLGSGTVRCAHGIMPVPAPGTAEILRGLPAVPGGREDEGERLTPTGAAILAEVVDAFAPPRAFRAERIGYGAGARDPAAGPPNLVRAQLGREERPPGTGVVWKAEVNLDDMTGEEIGYLVGSLRSAGALEVWTQAVQMKKDRPGVVVSALCREDRRGDLEATLFAGSTTLGLRWSRHERSECEREVLAVEVRGHPVRVKRRRRPGVDLLTRSDLKPGHEDLARGARGTGCSLRERAGEARDQVLGRGRAG